MKLAVLYLKFDIKKYPNSFEFVRGHLSKLDCQITFVDIDNAREEKDSEVVGNIHYIGGDNKNWEFSGWNKGLQYINNNIDYDTVLFANDACVRSGNKSIPKRLTNSLLRRIKCKNQFFGNICGNNRNDFIFKDKTLNQWVQSDSFVAPKEVLNSIKRVDFSDEIDIDSIIYENMNIQDFMSNPLFNEFAKEFIVEWLTKRWHSKFKIMENIPLFKEKTKAILNERILTYEVKRKGFCVKRK